MYPTLPSQNHRHYPLKNPLHYQLWSHLLQEKGSPLNRKNSDRYGGGGIDWYLAALKKYAVFSGRARRKEYWFFTLLSFFIIFALGLVEGALGIAPEIDVSVLGTLYILAVAIPWTAVGVRRLHDTGHSAWWLLIGLVPLIGSIILFVYMVEDSEPGQNAYGLNPKESSEHVSDEALDEKL